MRNTFINLNDRINEVLQNKEKLQKLIKIDMYKPYIFDLFHVASYPIVRVDSGFADIETELVKLFKEMYFSELQFSNDSFDNHFKSSIIEKLMNICQKPESIKFIQDSLLVLPDIDEQEKIEFKMRNKLFSSSDFNEMSDKPEKRFIAYCQSKQNGQLDQFPKKYLNYESIAEAQLINLFSEAPVEFVKLKIKNTFKYETLFKGREESFIFFHLQITAKDIENNSDDEITKEVTFCLGPYPSEIDENNLEIPDNMICASQGFIKKGEFEKFIKVRNGEEIEGIECFDLEMLIE